MVDLSTALNGRAIRRGRAGVSSLTDKTKKDGGLWPPSSCRIRGIESNYYSGELDDVAVAVWFWWMTPVWSV